MTTTDEALGAGDIDSVAQSLLLTPEDDTTEDTGAQDHADEQSADAADDAEVEDAGEAEEVELGEDDVEAAEEDDGDEEPQVDRFRVKVDGEEVEVTLDDLKRSFAGQGYIQKRMQEVAAIRKEAETVYTALNQERAQLAQALATYQQQLGSAEPQKPSKELMDRDPIAYFEQMEAYREAVEQRTQLQQQQAALTAQQQQVQQRAMQAYLAEQAQILASRIPQFADPKKAAELKQALVETGSAYGYSAEELKMIQDARAVQVLHDAMKYRQMMSGKQEVAKKVAQARPVVKPGAARSERDGKKAREQKVRARMKQTGSLDDVAAFLISKG